MCISYLYHDSFVSFGVAAVSSCEASFSFSVSFSFFTLSSFFSFSFLALLDESAERLMKNKSFVRQSVSVMRVYEN